MTRFKRAQPPTVRFALVRFALSGSAEPSSDIPLTQWSIRVEPQRRFRRLWRQKHQIPPHKRECGSVARLHGYQLKHDRDTFPQANERSPLSGYPSLKGRGWGLGCRMPFSEIESVLIFLEARIISRNAGAIKKLQAGFPCKGKQMWVL
jgi:hypothetical protein